MMYSLFKVERSEALKNGITVVRGEKQSATYTKPDFEYKNNFKRCFLFILPMDKQDVVRTDTATYYPNLENIFVVEEMWENILELCQYLYESGKEVPEQVKRLINDQLLRILDYSKFEIGLKSERSRMATMSIFNDAFLATELCGTTFFDYADADMVNRFVADLISSYEFGLLEMFFANSNMSYSEENVKAYRELCVAKQQAIDFFSGVAGKKGNIFTLKDAKFNVDVKIYVK